MKSGSVVKLMRAKLSPRTWLYLGVVLDALGILVIVVSYLVPFHFFLPPWNYRDATLEVDAHKAVPMECDFLTGSIIRGMVLNLGEENRGIDFYIEDSGGETLLRRDGILERYMFEFRPQDTGLYRLVLDNTIETPRSVYVIVWQYYYNILFLCLGFGIFISGVVLIATAPS